MDFIGVAWIINGGSAWESNPPGTLFTPHTGFEVQETHQRPAHFRTKAEIISYCR